MRINKYLALHKYASRREADKLIEAGRVYINNVPAVLGSTVAEGDVVEVKGELKTYRYFAYNKPRGIITHSPQGTEKSIEDILPIEGVFPLGRLDKDSVGLIILTDDGRITDALLNPINEHEKEYEVTTLDALPKDFKKKMERGVDIGGYITKPSRIEIRGTHTFSITITEGKKHQIRRMCGVFGASVTLLKRVRIENIVIGSLKEGAYRPIEKSELKIFLESLGM
ncbi:MAG: rRNA pseudouridine synthase [Candidatus Pacebacteria bacterium]|nr:rRNA pseudouridine synthase [Candidatus Paceibacterota bacterium]